MEMTLGIMLLKLMMEIMLLSLVLLGRLLGIMPLQLLIKMPLGMPFIQLLFLLLWLEINRMSVQLETLLLQPLLLLGMLQLG
jgi:hypothetical protein